MKLSLLAFTPVLLVPFLMPEPAAEPTAAEPAAAPMAVPATASPFVAPVHCQIPCGIYSDKIRIDLLMEDAATIEKGMMTLQAFQAEESPNQNQMVRWTMNKDQHAQNIQDMVAEYWLAQRIKVPAADADESARAKYNLQLSLMHEITVSAMKCKQTTDVSHVEKLRKNALAFAHTYFKGEDLEHFKEYEGHGHSHK